MSKRPQPKTADGKQSEAEIQQEFDERIASMAQQLGLNACDPWPPQPPNDLQQLQHLKLQLQRIEEEEAEVIRRLQEIRRVHAGFIESIRVLKTSITLLL